MVTLRAAVPDDAMAVARVNVRSWQTGYRGLLPTEYLDALDPADRAGQYTFGLTGDDKPGTTVAVDDRGDVLGFATIGPTLDPSGALGRGPDESDTGQLWALYVEPAEWGQGIGRLLLRDARNRLSARGFIEAELWMLQGNERADRFYRADGWQPDGRRQEDEVWGIRVIELCYRTTL